MRLLRNPFRPAFMVGVGVVLGGAFPSSSVAEEVVLARWTIATAFPTGAGNVPTGNFYSVGIADLGAQTAGSSLSSTHALAAATYTSPAGNGSQYSFSSNNWSPGDFYEARFSTAGYGTLSISWDQARSSTGPAPFKVLVSTDGVRFSEVFTYTVLQSGGGGAPGTWTTTTYNPIYTNAITLDASVNDRELVVVRFQNAATTVSASSGTSRIDNVTVTGTSIAVSGDVDGDGVVNAADLAIVLAAWGACEPKQACPADLDGDGQVGATDLATVLAGWTGA